MVVEEAFEECNALITALISLPTGSLVIETLNPEP